MPAIADPYASHYGAAADEWRHDPPAARAPSRDAASERADPRVGRRRRPDGERRACPPSRTTDECAQPARARACAAPHDRRSAPAAAGAFPRGDHPARCRARGRRRNQDDDRPPQQRAAGSGPGHGHGRTDPHERGRQPALQPGRAAERFSGRSRVATAAMEPADRSQSHEFLLAR